MKRRIIYGIVGFALLMVYTQFIDKDELQEQYFSKKTKIYLRQIGNQLLLSNQDSTSLILPVKRLSRTEFELSFQSHLLFSPDSLVDIVKRNLEKSELTQSYRVEVIQCDDQQVAYSYEILMEDQKTIIPCSNRPLPLRCYKIQFQFLEESRSKSKVAWLLLFFGAIVFVEFLMYRKREKDAAQQPRDSYAVLGSFMFYPDQNKLIKEAQEITLSKKECELLEIFVANPNQILKREDLTKRVWEDNGVFVGRSLDTYISKLRKKLQDDDSIKITNVHGVGYKLEGINSTLYETG